MNEQELVARAQAGSQEAFCELVERYKAQAVNIALGFLGNVEEAKDVSQEAFVNAYRALPRFRAQAQFRTWLYRIIVNECHSALRARGRRRRWQLPMSIQGDNHWIELVPDPRPGAREIAQEADRAQLLQGAIAHLSTRQRSVVTLRYLQGMSVDEVADVLGCASGTVKAQLARALRHLRVQLDSALEGVGHE